MKRNWTIQEDKLIREIYPDMSSKIVAEIMDRSIKSIYTRANTLKLKKSQEFLQSEASGRANVLSQKSIETRYKKGHSSWNKGMKGIQIGGKETRFKSGHLPHNTKYDGAITIRIDEGKKYQHIRMGLGKWIPLHRFIWEKQNGPIPPGMIVSFIDGNTMNCNIDNLQLITRKKNMTRNSFMRFPEEVRELVQVKRVLSRHINKRKTA